MIQLSPGNWKDYELIDSGEGEKLERFGKYVLRRPEPQAVWTKHLPEDSWKRKVHATFEQTGSHGGNWIKHRDIPDQWYIHYAYKGMKLRFRLGMTAFKHVGIFPEQAVNWEFLYDHLSKQKRAKVLNLFAYTGGASLAARAAGADVTHCDSIKSVVGWANVNMQASKLDNIRWLIEDAMKFVKREARRGNTYTGIILDPPAYGHGPKGEKWKLEDMINELTETVSQILSPREALLIFNSYSLGFSPLVLQNLMITHFPSSHREHMEVGELFLPEQSGRKLPMGIFARFVT